MFYTFNTTNLYDNSMKQAFLFEYYYILFTIIISFNKFLY